MAPPRTAASRWETASPSPVPRMPACSGPWTCSNSSKMRSRSSGAIPMPVSATMNATVPRSWSRRAQTRTSPSAVNFSALETRLRSTCATFDSSERIGRQIAGRLEHQRHAIVVAQRAEHAAQRREQVLDRERIGVHDRLTGLDSREVEQVVDERKQRLGAVADVDDLALLLLGQRSVGPIEQQVAQSQHRAQGCPQLVAHAGQESRLGLAVAPQLLGTLVELGVQRHHTAVGFLELAVEARELLSARGQLLECAHQLLVLKLQLAGRIIDLSQGERIGDFAELGGSRRRLHEPFGDRDRGPARRARTRSRNDPSACARRRSPGPCRWATR